jgi:pimeloyl-ACP methyl ester carboxylesterase
MTTRSTPVRLFHRDLGGTGPHLVVLHGFLGSSRNWQAAGRELSAHFRVHLLDLRNHGDSPHAPESDYASMTRDIIEWLDENGLERADILGHSMGGKVAMRLASRSPGRLGLLFVVDIAPRAYGVGSVEVEALRRLDVASLRSRAEADEILGAWIPDRATRQFLLMNLARDGEGGFRWLVNLAALEAAIPVLRASPLDPDDVYHGEALFIAGGRSRFVTAEDERLIEKHFPRAEVVRLERADHNPHVEDLPALVDAVAGFAARKRGA